MLPKKRLRLSRIDINGFKSFAKKTQIVLSNGITAVIGPNGSGKSNISDAVRWVLGEQSAKALRGSKMEDVIFNGTQTRRPQSFCEVTLTFDNSDNKLPIAFNEVAITRRVFRSGESEYCINGSTCRLKDVLELFRDTGIGKDGYSIISQGKVDDILSNKSNDRRAALEEAAGVMRYRVRKEEAERKLDHTQKNMERLLDILNELESRLGPLEQQSRTAREFLKLRDELKELEINMFLYQTDRGNERLAALNQTIQQLENDLNLNLQTDKELSNSIRNMEQNARELDASISNQQNALLAILSAVESNSGECKLLMERKANCQREQQRLNDQIADLNTQKQQVSEALNVVEQVHQDDAAVRELDGAIAQKQKELDLKDESLATAEAELENMKNAVMEAMNRIADAKSALSGYEAMGKALNERLLGLAQRQSDAAALVGALTEELDAANSERLACIDRQTAVQNELSAARDNRQALQQQLKDAQDSQLKLEQQSSSLQSRIRVLREMIKSKEGYQNSVKLLMQDAQNNQTLQNSMMGVVAELITVPKELELAIDTTLGGTMQNIITRTAEDAKLCIDYLKTKDYGRATFLPLSMLSITKTTDKERSWLNANGVIGLASELVEGDSTIRPAIDYLLGRTIIVKDLTCGIALKKQVKNAFHIATLGGDFISTGGTMSGGSVKKRNFGLLGREREVRELSQRLAKAQAEALIIEKRITELNSSLSLATVQVDSFTLSLNQAATALAVVAEKLDIIARDRDNALQNVQNLCDERTEIEDNLNRIASARQGQLDVQAQLDDKNIATKADIIKAQTQLSNERKQREELSNQLTNLKIRQAAMHKEADARQAELNRLKKEQQTLDSRLSHSAYELESMIDTQAKLAQRLLDMEQSLNVEQDKVNAAKQEQQRLENERNNLLELIEQQRQSRDGLSEQYRITQDKRHKTELSLAKLKTDLQLMQDKIWEDYSLTYDNAAVFRRDIPIASTNGKIASLRAQIRELGNINMSSIEDYTAVSERYNSLSTQYQDLQNAKEDLHKLIAQLTESMEQVFTAEFQKVQQNFEQVFSSLFKGGHAELRLSDKKDVLGCDIDIIAQPPGKKLQLLSLLSGGERALTAIALLFAMLQLKAPAFCVLDEIETSLDEANVSRFADYLKSYSHDTQFIIITHRKGSMEVCDSLYGVAMEEKGVSTIVSAKFEEAT